MILGNATLTVIRRAASTDAGREGYIPGAETTFEITTGSPQPVKGSDSRMLPERLQTSAMWKVYAPVGVDIRASAILPGGARDQTQLPDMIEYEGTRYRVYADNRYRHFLIRHVKLWLVLPETAEGRPDGF